MSQARPSCSVFPPGLSNISSLVVGSTSLLQTVPGLPTLVLTKSGSRSDSTSAPINLQSTNPGSVSLTLSSQPMSASVTELGPSSSISARPISRLPDSPGADPEPTSMSSSDPPGEGPVTTNTRIDEISTTPTPSPPGSPTPATSSSTRTPAPPPAGTPTRTSNGGRPTIPRTSTTTSVVSVRPSTQSTIFVNVTSSVDSTLSTPTSIPVTNPVNGLVSLTAPPLVTILSTSTDPDGGFVTFTHIVANPVDSDHVSRTTGFLGNRGEVAGVFAAIGVVATVIVIGLVWFIRRRRRIQRRKAWFSSLRQHPPPSFQDTHDGPFMRSIQTQSEVINEPRIINYNDTGYRPQSPDDSSGLGMAGIGTAIAGPLSPVRRPLSGGDPFRDPQHNAHSQVYQKNAIGLALSLDRFNELPQRSAQSSPSIYPESLPPTDEPPKPIEPEFKPQPRPLPRPRTEPLLRRSLSVGQADTPPRPPRSHLRESVNKMTEYIPLTSPSSLSSHGHSKPSSPETEQGHKGLPDQSTTRGILLGARPRTAPDNSPS